MFTIENLTKTYKNNVTAVNDFHLKIDPHQIVAVAGPNGSGKTTMINCILGIIKHTEGKIHLQGVTNDEPSFKKQVAYVPDDLLLPEALTGAEYLEFVSSMYECKTIHRRNQLIELFDMDSALSRPIETYSHGMKKDTADCCLYA